MRSRTGEFVKEVKGQDIGFSMRGKCKITGVGSEEWIEGCIGDRGCLCKQAKVNAKSSVNREKQ